MDRAQQVKALAVPVPRQFQWLPIGLSLLTVGATRLPLEDRRSAKMYKGLGTSTWMPTRAEDTQHGTQRTPCREPSNPPLPGQTLPPQSTVFWGQGQAELGGAPA